MARDIYVRCSFGDESAVFVIPDDVSYDNLCYVIRTKFLELESSTFESKFSMPGMDQCDLCNDEDLKIMFALMPICAASHVDIMVTCTGVAAYIPDIEIPIAEPEVEPLLEYEAEEMSGRKVFLSDQWRNAISHVNQCFHGGAVDFRIMLGRYAIATGFEVRFKKNDVNRVTAYCAKRDSEGCGWFVHAVLARTTGSFYIKKLINEHTCIGRMMCKRSKMLTSKVVASVIEDKFRAEPWLTPNDVMKTLKGDYGITVPYWNAWYGKEMVSRDILGDDDKSYKMLSRYVTLLQDSNPDTHCSLEVENDTYKFSRLFIAIGGSIKGFQRCRPVLSLDATFLKSKFKGTLMVAAGKDGNDGMYPLCFAVVDSENSDNWSWFMGKLAEILRPQKRVVTIISDRNRGLLDAVRRTFPTWPHAFCIYHLKNNIRSLYPGTKNHDTREKVLTIFNKCAYTSKISSFNRYIAELISIGGDEIKEFLRGLNPKNYANAHFPGNRYGDLCSNIAESFNSWILKQRTLPITQLVDGIRTKMMTLIGDRRAKSSRWSSILCPTHEKTLEHYDKCTLPWFVRQANVMLFEVEGKIKYSVDLAKCTCSCGKWRATGFVCPHAFVAIKQMGWNIYDYADPYFRADVYRECHSFPIYPVPSIDEDELEGIDEEYARPPTTRKQPGRPRKNRFKSRGEKAKGTMTCGRCGQVGSHNRRTCTAPI